MCASYCGAFQRMTFLLSSFFCHWGQRPEDEPQILNSKYHMAPIESWRDSQNFLLKLPKLICTILASFIFQAPTEHPVEFWALDPLAQSSECLHSPPPHGHIFNSCTCAPGTVPAFLFFLLIRYTTWQSNLGGREFISIYAYSPLWNTVRPGAQGRTWGQELKQKPWRNTAYWLVQPAFWYYPGTLSQGWHHPSDLGPPASIINQGNAPPTCLEAVW